MDLTYTPAGIENVLGKNGIRHSREQWMAARRAILHQGMHKDQSDSRNRLHTMYSDLQGAPSDLNAKKDVVSGTLDDTFDAVRTIFTLHLRC